MTKDITMVVMIVVMIMDMNFMRSGASVVDIKVNVVDTMQENLVDTTNMNMMAVIMVIINIMNKDIMDMMVVTVVKRNKFSQNVPGTLPNNYISQQVHMWSGTVQPPR